MNYTVNDIKKQMSTHPIWVVKFLKKSGAERVMYASRDWRFLEENADELSYKTPVNKATWDAESRDMIRVWDCSEEGWRTIPAGERLLSLERLVD